MDKNYQKRLKTMAGSDLLSEMDRLMTGIKEADQRQKDRGTYLALENLERVVEAADRIRILKALHASNPEMSRGAKTQFNDALYLLPRLSRFELLCELEYWESASAMIKFTPVTSRGTDQEFQAYLMGAEGSAMIDRIRSVLSEQARRMTQIVDAHVPDSWDRHDRRGGDLRQSERDTLMALKDLYVRMGDHQSLRDLLREFGGRPSFDPRSQETASLHDVAGDRENVLRFVRSRINALGGLVARCPFGNEYAFSARMAMKYGFHEEIDRIFRNCVHLGVSGRGLSLATAAMIALETREPERLKLVMKRLLAAPLGRPKALVWQEDKECHDALLQVAKALGEDEVYRTTLEQAPASWPLRLY